MIEGYLSRFQHLLVQKDFHPLSAPNGNGYYLRVENPICYLLALQETKDDTPERQADIHHTAQQLHAHLEQLQCSRLICLSITFGIEFSEKPLSVWDTDRSGTLHFIRWQYALEQARLSAAPGCPDRLLGIEKLLDMAARGEKLPADSLRTDTEGKRPFCTYAICILCALLVLLPLLSGQLAEVLSRFCNSRDGVLGQSEYYRLLTAMFFHTGIGHLAANSVYLIYFGSRAELLLGKGRFLLLYLLSGLCGNLLSLVCSGYPAVGASGAVFGLLGAMLVLSRTKGSSYVGMNYTTMLLLAFSALAMGFLNVGVDNWAHLGGFFSGALLFFIMMRVKKA